MGLDSGEGPAWSGRSWRGDPLFGVRVATGVAGAPRIAEVGRRLYSYWTRGDFGVNLEHPPVVKLLASFPLLGR